MTLSRMLAAALQRLVDRIDPQEGRYRMLFESSPLPMWVFDAETLRFLAANEARIRVGEPRRVPPREERRRADRYRRRRLPGELARPRRAPGPHQRHHGAAAHAACPGILAG